jgi:hypothetical protein
MEQCRETLKEQWGLGVFQVELTIEGIALANAEARGKMEQLKQLLELDYEQFHGSLSDE